jgi:hypothetical protein
MCDTNVRILTMTRDLQEIKRGIAQARQALNLLETLIGEWETRMVNILPREDVRFYKASDDEIICGEGTGTLESLNQKLHDTAEELHSV